MSRTRCDMYTVARCASADANEIRVQQRREKNTTAVSLSANDGIAEQEREHKGHGLQCLKEAAKLHKAFSIDYFANLKELMYKTVS